MVGTKCDPYDWRNGKFQFQSFYEKSVRYFVVLDSLINYPCMLCRLRYMYAPEQPGYLLTTYMIGVGEITTIGSVTHSPLHGSTAIYTPPVIVYSLCSHCYLNFNSIIRWTRRTELITHRSIRHQ